MKTTTARTTATRTTAVSGGQRDARARGGWFITGWRAPAVCVRGSSQVGHLLQPGYLFLGGGFWYRVAARPEPPCRARGGAQGSVLRTSQAGLMGWYQGLERGSL